MSDCAFFKKLVEAAGRGGVGGVEHAEIEDRLALFQDDEAGAERRVRHGTQQDGSSNERVIHELRLAAAVGEGVGVAVERVELAGIDREVFGQKLSEEDIRQSDPIGVAIRAGSAAAPGS